MEIIIQKTPEDAAALTAKLIAYRLKKVPDMTLGLATGRTMEDVYAYLCRLHKEEKLDFSHCHTFNLDEYIGIPPGSLYSYRYYMNRHLFSKVNIPHENTHLLNGMADDFAGESQRYEKLIKACGGIDLQLLGIGNDGHIGFNEPLSSLRSRTREKALTPATIAQNAPLCGNNGDTMPHRALTMGVGTICDAREIILLATGTTKAEIIAKATEGPVTAMVTASALQLHPNCKIIVDEDAAQCLKEKEYYHWIFANEPEWEAFR